jgi:CelD/BcsL family acetyltransferase involved in cellulose biosynthesis
MSLKSEVVGHPDQVDAETRAAWDALAEAAASPCCLSAWQLAAAAHLGDGAQQIVLLRDGDRLVGVAPFRRNRWAGPLWIESVLQVAWDLGHGVAPLAAPGREGDLARAIAERLPESGPPISMLTVAWDDLDSPWPDRIAAAWPRRMHRRLEGTQVCPVITMAEDHQAWRLTRSKSFREDVRQKRKAVEKRGGVVRRSDDPATAGRDVAGMFATHHARFAAMGKASNLSSAHEAALVAAAPDLVAGGHLRLWVIEHEGAVVAAQLHVRAGDRMLFYMGGMAPGWEKQGPGLVLLHAAVDDAHALGARTLDLGPGPQPYKLRFSDTERHIGSHDLFVVDPRYPLVRARLARKHLTAAARRRAADLPEERRDQLKRLLRR